MATISRWMYGIEAPPFLAKNLADRFPGYTGPIDRWQIVTFEAPSTIAIDGGVAMAESDSPDGDRSQGIAWYVLNTITPAEDGRCHYFWAFVRNYRLTDQSITTRQREDIARVFEEDRRMLEAQQCAIGANPDYEFYNLNIDAGSMWVRRIIAKLIDAESDSAPSSVRGSVTG
jgi:vanillate O-demethylase monooxygenase subunit